MPPAIPAAQQSISTFPGSETARQRGFTKIGRRVAGIGQRVKMPSPSLNAAVDAKQKTNLFGGAGPVRGAMLY